MSVTSIAPAAHNVSLTDKYELPQGRVYMTGTQALVRLLMAQKERDAAAGLNTGGFVSGYRGFRPRAVESQKIPGAKQHCFSARIE
jgi:indolepyruvate ferredoxin oxidoreductase